MKVKVKPQQSLLDIALQEYGSVQALIQLLQSNPGLEATSRVAAGSELKITGAIINPIVQQKFQTTHKTATASGEHLGGDFDLMDFNTSDFN